MHITPIVSIDSDARHDWVGDSRVHLPKDKRQRQHRLGRRAPGQSLLWGGGAQQTWVSLTSMLPTQASVVVQHPDSQVELQQAYCLVYGSITHGMPGPQQAPLHGVSPVGPAWVQR